MNVDPENFRLNPSQIYCSVNVYALENAKFVSPHPSKSIYKLNIEFYPNLSKQWLHTTFLFFFVSKTNSRFQLTYVQCMGHRKSASITSCITTDSCRLFATVVSTEKLSQGRNCPTCTPITLFRVLWGL